jgi:UPF0755 protein
MKASSSGKAIVFLLFFLVFIFISYFLFYVFTPTDQQEELITIEVQRGMTFREINSLLTQSGIVKHPLFFHLLAEMHGATDNIKAGEYELSRRSSPWEILRKLIRGEVKAFMVTFPEDINKRQIIATLTALRLVKEEEFLRLASDREFLKSLGIDSPTLEGYLFPDTYKFDRTMGTERIIRVMVGRFWQNITPELRGQLQKMGLTLAEAVILASLIGKETGLTEEKALVSAVFHNRLRRGMRLQSDPTAVYNLENFSGRIRRKHLRRDSPHNTYLIAGLPPTAIANPGADSLKAALQPAQVNYLYFVSKTDGSHHFSESYRDHRQAVIKYLINREKN